MSRRGRSSDWPLLLAVLAANALSILIAFIATH